ncbi:uncharacterized protein LOC111359833 [Spodoptera litura]|uniref:Uncharacterized protein LOC111359833 n=1 Tax=Spodoptera litura TaxID=69820 RepID=A0A9J7IY41_SPOLT|nr:uncharacterized protein LOC111359833 [Spodoptera litura]
MINIFFGILSLLIATIGASSAPKIQIFEIRENENGIRLKNLNPDARSNPKTDPLAKLLRGPKPDNQAVKLAKQLLSKLKTMREDDKTNRYYDQGHHYTPNNDDYNTDYEETHFVDKTRSDKPAQDNNSFKELLLQLLRSQKKGNAYANPVSHRIPKRGLRSDQVLVESRTSIPKRKHEYVYDDNDARMQQQEDENQYNNY